MDELPPKVIRLRDRLARRAANIEQLWADLEEALAHLAWCQMYEQERQRILAERRALYGDLTERKDI